MIDVAIIGGGVAGCYCAYRLAGAGADVSVFEASNRVGGRLWSVPIKNFSGPPAEIGGMYFKDMHVNVGGLVQHLGLATERVNFVRAHQFLRGQFLDDAAYTENSPFGLRANERGKSPAALLGHALEQVAPGSTDLWPVNHKPPRSRRDTFQRLREIRHHGRPLHEYSLWNVFADVLSADAYAVLLSVWGSVGLFRNINAFDGVWNLLHEMGEGRGNRIVDGYQRLPEELQAHAQTAGAEFHIRHKALKVSRTRDAFQIVLEIGENNEAQRLVSAKRIILALPQRALQLISLDAALFEDFEAFQRIRDFAVKPTRSCKVFLSFDKPWWNESIIGPAPLGALDVAAAYTDLPMQQCYFFGGPHEATSALLMAAYADDAGAAFWSSLASSSAGDFKSAANGAGHDAALRCAESVVASSRRQLGEMHRDVRVPAPTGALFFDWDADPYGGAWHGWAPHFKSWEIRPWMRQPNPSLDLFICGEAYSQRNGWVEGAINSAEKILERFGLPRPGWITDPDFQFEIDDEGDMHHDERSWRTALRAV